MGEALRGCLPAVLAWALVISRGRGGGVRRRVRWVLLGLASSLTAQVPYVYITLGQVTGVPYAARLVSHAGMVFTAWSAQEVMAGLGGRPRGPRWQAWWAAGGFAAMCGLFVSLPDILPQSPRVMEYCLVYAAAQAPALTAVIVLGTRYARQARDPVLRASLLLVVTGTVLAVGYLLNKSALAMAPRLSYEFPAGRQAPLGKALPTAAYTLVLLGAALPAADTWLYRYQQFRRLGPLWRALYDADPAIALDPPGVPDALVVRHLRPHLYRRVIEIRDGLLALQPYRAPADDAPPGERAATDEAAAIAAALAARAAGVPPGAPPAGVTGGASLAGDIAYLGRVSLAYRAHRRSPRSSPTAIER